MDFRQLRYFVAVAEELSFSRAARRLHVSQPPLSMQIKAIEQELGTSLFARTKRNVTLTKAGQVLLEQARDALSQLDRAGEMVRRAGRGEAGRLTVGFTSSVPLLDIFAQILRRFRSLYPDAKVEARLMSTGEQLAALAERRIDIGILRPPYWFKPAAALSVRRLWRDELYVFLPDDHALLREPGPIPPAALAAERFITFESDLGCGLSEHVAMLCSNAGFRPRVAQEVSVASSILGLVAAGVGIAILPKCQERAGIASVVGRELDALDTTSDLLLAHRGREANPLLESFLAVADAIAPELAEASGLAKAY
jgi:DNA-binding transcriptional LysR family regulator